MTDPNVVQKDGYQVEVVEYTPEQLERMVDLPAQRSMAELLAGIGEDQRIPPPEPPVDDPTTGKPAEDSSASSNTTGGPVQPPVEAPHPFDIPDRPPYEGDARGDKRHTWQDQGWVEYLGTVYVYFHYYAFEDFFKGRMGERMVAFFKAIPEGFGEGATGTWDSFVNAYKGWKAIVNHPAVLGELDDATVDMIKALEAQVQHLDYLAQTNNPEFGTAIGKLTGQAMFDTVTGRVQDIVLKKGLTALRLTNEAAQAGSSSGVVTRAADGAPPPGQVAGPSPPPAPQRQPAPYGQPAPVDAPDVSGPRTPTGGDQARANKLFPDPVGNTRAVTPKNSLGTFAQVDPRACAIATLRGILRDLGYFVPDEAWLVDLAKSLGIFDAGMNPIHVRVLVDKLAEMGRIPKLHVDAFGVLDMVNRLGVALHAPTNLVAWLRRNFSDSPLLGAIYPPERVGHAIRLEEVMGGVAHVGDPLMPTGVGVAARAGLLDKWLGAVLVFTPDGKRRPPSWLPRLSDVEPGLPTGNLLHTAGLAAPVAIGAGTVLRWPVASLRNFAAAGAAAITVATLTFFAISFLIGGGGDDTAAAPADASGITDDDDGGSLIPGDPDESDPGDDPGTGGPGDDQSPPEGNGQDPPGDGGADDPPDDEGGQQPPDDGDQDPPDDDQPQPPADPPADEPAPTPNDPTPTPPPDDPVPTPEEPPTPTSEPVEVPILQSGYYGLTFIPLVHPHACCINPPGDSVLIYLLIGTDTGARYFHVENLVGPSAPDLILEGGPFMGDGPYTLNGSSTFLESFSNVPVEFTFTLEDRHIVGQLFVGGANLPMGAQSSWDVSGDWSGPVP